MYWDKQTQAGKYFYRFYLCIDGKDIKASCTAYRLSDGYYDPAVSWIRYGDEVSPQLMDWIKYGERPKARLQDQIPPIWRRR